MRLGALCVTFITVFTHCNCASLEVLIDGNVAESPVSCVGENITFVCTVASLGHAWTVGSFVTRQAVLARDDEDITEVGVFTFRRVSVSGGAITSSVSVLSFSDLNNVMIECVDGGGGPEEQNIVTQVYGSTSAPRLTVLPTLTSFVLTPQAPEDNPRCVINYNIIPAGDDSVMREDILVAIEDLGVAILVDGYDVCLYTYNFTIVATTLTGELRATVSQDDTSDLSGAAAITGLGGTSDGLVWSAPVNAMECSFQYMITLDANPNISLTVHTNSVSFTDLNRAGFLPTCVRQDVTVTPVVPINNQILDNSSATESLLIISINTTISVTVDELNVTFIWSTEVGGLDFVFIGLDSESMVTVDYTEGQYTVSLDCSYVGQSVTFNGMFISDDCRYDASIAPAEIVLGDNCDSTSRGESGGGSTCSSVVLITVVSVVLFIVNHVGVVDGFATHHPHPLLHSMRK